MWRVIAIAPTWPHADRVAVGRRLRSRLDPDRQRAAGPVLDDDLLVELLRHLRREQPHDVVGRASRGLRHDELDWAIGVLRE
jgi:hypothetical protein